MILLRVILGVPVQWSILANSFPTEQAIHFKVTARWSLSESTRKGLSQHLTGAFPFCAACVWPASQTVWALSDKSSCNAGYLCMTFQNIPQMEGFLEGDQVRCNHTHISIDTWAAVSIVWIPTPPSTSISNILYFVLRCLTLKNNATEETLVNVWIKAMLVKYQAINLLQNMWVRYSINPLIWGWALILNFSSHKMGAYSRWTLNQGWARNQSINNGSSKGISLQCHSCDCVCVWGMYVWEGSCPISFEKYYQLSGKMLLKFWALRKKF